MAEISGSEWKGKVTAELESLSAELVWGFVADFCNIHNLFPNLDMCYAVEGEVGKPGVVRYCSSASSGKWVKEKLLIINPAERCLSYEIVDNNMGFKSYVATFKVFGEEDASVIEWSFVSDPIEGMGFRDLESYADSCLQFMAKKIQATCVSC